MRRLPALLATIGLLSSCGGGPSPEYRFLGGVTACETLEWAREYHDLLDVGDTTGADRYASGRCFSVERDRRVRVEESEGGFPGGLGRWALVTTRAGEPLEHLASAELRETLGQPIRTEGWVAGSRLERIE